MSAYLKAAMPTLAVVGATWDKCINATRKSLTVFLLRPVLPVKVKVG
jgi:hypothetical protein